ncbi:MAG: hypothetical protein LBE21_11285 [Pseudomonadales bacterium]|jgi:hypothetical protein|nr:hypothetical protein [Pseudomonadales bacterium]
MRSFKQGLVFAVFFALLGGQALAAAAEGGGAPRGPAARPGLFFEETWKQVAKGGENPILPAHMVNRHLELKLYGPDSAKLAVTGVAVGEPGYDANPIHTWSGLCGAGCTFAFRDRNSYADLTGAARVMVQTKTSGFHKIHPFIKLADGSTYIGDIELGQTSDFLFEEFRFDQVRWMAFDTELAVTRGNLIDRVDLSKVDEIGFTDLQPGGGHGPGGWSDVAVIRVYGNAVPR